LRSTRRVDRFARCSARKLGAREFDETSDHRIVAIALPRKADLPARGGVAQRNDPRIAQQILRARRHRDRADNDLVKTRA
jgi:hypothetical protein